MENFKINERITIACEWKKTRNGFKHEAVLLVDGSEQERVKCCYLNRTWEQYTYQSVIHKLLGKSRLLTADDKAKIKAYLDGTDGYNGAGVDRDMSGLRTVGMVAKLGEIFCKGDQKAINDWKTRMLTAGLGNLGLEMPEDWGTLSEEDRTARLDAVIKQLDGKPEGESIKDRLEYLRGEIRAERISYGEIAELQSLKEHIADDDVELLEWAGVSEEEYNSRKAKKV